MKFNEFEGYIKAISNEEFEILLKLAFTLKEFQIDNIRKNFRVDNDFVFDLSRVETRGILRKEKIIKYIAYVDRKPSKYGTSWISDFIQDKGTNLDEIEKILLMNTNKIQKIKIDKLNKKKFKFLIHKNCINYLFRMDDNKNFGLLEKLYPHENLKWNQKSSEEKRKFCDQINVPFREFDQLWKYPLSAQSKLIHALSNTKESKQQENYAEEQRYSKQNYSKQNYSKQRQSEPQDPEERLRQERLEQDIADFNWRRFFGILDISENSTGSEIKAAYRVAMKTSHTDKFENTPAEDKEKARAKTSHLTAGMKLLKDSKKV